MSKTFTVTVNLVIPAKDKEEAEAIVRKCMSKIKFEEIYEEDNYEEEI